MASDLLKIQFQQLLKKQSKSATKKITNSTNKAAVNLEDMKSFKLDIAAAFSQHVHHCLEVLRLTYVPGHYVEVVAFQQQFTK